MTNRSPVSDYRTDPFAQTVSVRDCDAALHRLALDLSRVDGPDRLELQDVADRWLDRRFLLTCRCPDQPSV